MTRSRTKAFSLAVLVAIVAVGVRLVGLTQPFSDSWSWRQSDVAAIARNFSENGFRFARPQIDWAGDASGYVGTEFPILPFAVALIYRIAGVHEWIGRLETILFFALSLPFFYLLGRRIFGETAALWALFFYGFAPLNLMASRAFMPDAPSLSLSVVGIYYFLRWLEEEGRWSWLIGAGVSISLALLIKVTSAVVGAPLLYLAVVAVSDRLPSSNPSSGGQRLSLQSRIGFLAGWPQLWIFAAVSLLPSAAWSWHASQIAAKYYPHHFFGAGGFEIMNLRWYAGIVWRGATVSLTPVLFFLALAGVFVKPTRKYGYVFHWWLGTMVLFTWVLGYGNRHPWYQLPFVPVAAALAGFFCQFIARKLSAHSLVRPILAATVALLFAIVSFAYARSLYAPASSDLQELGLRLRKITPPDALIVAADFGDPTLFYYAHRKGWHFLEKNGLWVGPPFDSARAIANLEELRNRGANYIVFPFRARWWLNYYRGLAEHLQRNAILVERTPEFAIYKFEPARE